MGITFGIQVDTFQASLLEPLPTLGRVYEIRTLLLYRWCNVSDTFSLSYEKPNARASPFVCRSKAVSIRLKAAVHIALPGANSAGCLREPWAKTDSSIWVLSCVDDTPGNEIAASAFRQRSVKVNLNADMKVQAVDGDYERGSVAVRSW